MTSRISFATAAASSRDVSQDHVVVIERGATVVVVVADGMGGSAGGELASAAFVDAVQGASWNIDSFDVRAWAALLRDVDAQLVRGMVGETTAIVIAISEDTLAGVSVGDSEAWLVGDEGIERVTAKQGRARLGSGRAMPSPFFARMRGRRLVVATDGLFGQVSAEAITRAAATGSVAGSVERLVAEARLSSGGYADDVAVAVIDGTGEDRH